MGWSWQLLSAMLTPCPVAGSALYIADQYLHPRNLATALILLACACILERRRLIAKSLHPCAGHHLRPPQRMGASSGLSFCVCLALCPQRSVDPPPAAQPIHSHSNPRKHSSRTRRRPTRLASQAAARWLGRRDEPPPLLLALSMDLVRVARRSRAPCLVLDADALGPLPRRDQACPLRPRHPSSSQSSTRRSP